MTHQATRQPGRRALVLLAALVILFVIAQYGGALLTGGVYHSDDAANSYYPSHEMTRRALLDWTLPFWEPGSWSGWPAIVDPYHGVYYPLNVLFYVVGGARGLAPTVALHVLIAAAGMFAFLRLRGLGAAACLTGALAYALSSFMVVRVDHVGFIQMAAWVPWILWALDRWLETRTPGSLPALAAVCGLAVLAGGGPLGVVAALPMAAYALLRLAQSAKREGGGIDVRRGLVNAAAVGGAIAVGLMIAAAQLLPSLTHLPESPRALATGYSFASSYAWPDLRYAMTLVWPDFFGNVSRGGYAGVSNYTEIAGYYVGIGAYMLAPFAVFWRAPAARRLELLILALVAVVGFVAALGDAGPVHPILYDWMPLYASLRCPVRALFIVVLVVPILAAHGVEALVGQPRRSAVRLALAIAVTVIPVAMAGWGLRALPAGAEAAVACARAGGWRLLFFALTAGGLIVALAWRGPSRGRTTALGVALALLLGVDLVAQSRGQLTVDAPTFPAGSERYQAVEWVAAHGHGWRFANDGRGPMRLHNVGMTYGMENASGYDSVPIWRYVNFLQVVNRGRPYQGQLLRDDLASAAITNFESPLLDLLSVRFVITHRALDSERFRLVFAPSAAAARPWVDRAWDMRLRVYENRHVLPRAFVVYDARVVRGARNASYAIAEPGFDPARTVILEERPAVMPIAVPGAGPSLTPAAVRLHERHALIIDAVAERKGILVISEVSYPGWTATVDGQPAPLLRANYALRGVALTPGSHRVELRYRNRAAIGGLALTSIGVVVTIGAAVGLRRRGVRRPGNSRTPGPAGDRHAAGGQPAPAGRRLEPGTPIGREQAVEPVRQRR